MTMYARILIIIALLFPVVALAQPVGSGSAVALNAGSASATPADKLHDPTSSPAASWDDVKVAKKVGWPLAVFAVLVMLARLVGKLGGKVSWLAKGKAAVIVGAVGAIAASCYNAAADGGAWTATLMAGAGALFHYLDAGGKQA